MPLSGSFFHFCEKLSSGRVSANSFVKGTVKPNVLSSTAKFEASAIQALNNPAAGDDLSKY
jgi:hypothetical protein